MPQRAARAARSPQARIEEAVGLALAIDLDVVETGIVTLAQIRPATYIGKGKVEEIAGLVKAREIELVVMDCALSPVQQRNLEKAWSAKVLDRTGLILEIFGKTRADQGGRAAGRARASHLPEEPAGALLDASGAPARRLRFSRRAGRDPDRGRPPHDRGAHRAHRDRTGKGQEAPQAASREPQARAVSDRGAWSATPMPASRRCSTA